MPTNIDFESGSLSDWFLYTGTSTPLATPTLGYVAGRHTLTSGAGLDSYGGFPVVDPQFPGAPTFASCNNRNYSFKLGDSIGLMQAQRARFYVTVPSGGSYHLRFRYALVLHDMCCISHLPIGNAPKLIVDATDTTTNTIISCAHAELTKNIPGTLTSTVIPSVGVPTLTVGYKSWTTGSIDLSSASGHVVALDFTTHDCTGDYHFGYAYIDFVDICPVTQTPCAGGFMTTLQGPPGFMNYKWYNSSFSLVGTGQTPAPVPAPSVASTYALVVTSIASGAAGAGCNDTLYFPVNPMPPGTLSLTPTVCVGSSTTLSWSPAGTWSSSSPSIATIGSTSGVLTGITNGTTTISYKESVSGCVSTKVATVNPLPSPITGEQTVCVLSAVSLSSSTTGGTWSSSNPSVGTINSSGIVTGISGGTTIISYILPTGCMATIVVTVNPIPAPISGTFEVCTGLTTTLSETTSGGTWSSSNLAVGTITSSGVVTGISYGTTTISYTLSTGCYVTGVVTVHALPLITYISPICVSQTQTVDAITFPGGTWSISSTSIATIFPGGPPKTIFGLAGGTATLTYTASTGCVRTTVVTVLPMPDPIGIALPATSFAVCEGATVTLTNTTSGGGIWTSVSTGVATIGSSTGIVTGVSGGTSVISFTSSTTGCITSIVMTVIGTPDMLLGDSLLCTGEADTWTVVGAGSTAWSTISWVSSSPGIATAGSTSGIITGVSAGTSIITCTISSTICPTSFITEIVTVNPTPGTIVGPSTICLGDTTTLSNSLGGGVWTTGDASVLPFIGSTGQTWGASVGTSVITYTVGECSVSTTMSVTPLPDPISGVFTVCTGLTTPLSDGTVGGTWVSSSTGVAAVDPVTGIVTGVTPGTVTISYILSTGCYRTTTVTVSLSPAPITGDLRICMNDTTILTDTISGGTWSSLSPSIAYITAGGTVIGGLPGTTTILYTMPGGCISSAIVTVDPVPSILGPFSVCTGETISIAATIAGGTWTSTLPAIGSIETISGNFSGISTGTTVISYIMATGCFDTAVITVFETPVPISGTLTTCVGSTTILSDATIGGTWSTSDASIATVGILSGVVSGISGGTVTITYRVVGDCQAIVTVTVNPLPGTISGDLSICTGSTTPLVSSPSGGTWSSSAPSVGSVGSISGIVTGISPGTTIITYTSTSGCITTAIVTVSLSPGPIMGPLELCIGFDVMIFDTVSGGTWSTTDIGIIELIGMGDSAFVYGITSGTAVVTYMLPTGCFITAVVTVNPLPSISGVVSVCEGGISTLFASIPGGTWACSPVSIATISAGGVVTAGTPGTAIVTYTLPTGCLRMVAFAVNPPPTEFVGDTIICVSDTSTLHSLPTGGTWISSNPLVATINPVSGLLTGISGGTASITYTLTTGCRRTATVTINTIPAVLPITGGPGVLCLGGADTLDCATPGGSWSTSSSSTVSIATLPISSGIPGISISGLSLGTAVITYSLTNICGTNMSTYSVNVITTPTVSAITGILGVCSGFTDTLYASPFGGTWNSSSPGIASIDPITGIVTGHTTGSVTISYTIVNPCGTVRSTVNVLVNMEPYITTNFMSACESYMPPTDGIHPSISFGTECVKVCDSSMVRYYANGVAGSSFTWIVTGGSVFADYGDSIDVFWSGVGMTGSITLHDTFMHCIDSARACIRVIDRPDASFSIPYSSYCLGSSVPFTDMSTGDPSSAIVNWYWNFGDGTSSSAPGSVVHSYSTAGTFTVTLVVKNACNCRDSFQHIITIDSFVGPDIVCPSVVCDSDFVTYTTTAICPSYIWTVNGGSIVSGLGTSAIRVHWDMADSNGYGQITLETPSCSACNRPTTIRIPIILASPQIVGNDTICTDAEYLYKLPLWPATEYAWGVIGNPSAIPTWVKNDYKVSVKFTTSGTYTIHARYQNRITLCGGNIFKTVTVLPPSSIVGSTVICSGSTATYSLTGAYSGDWQLSDATGSPVTSISGSVFSYTFLTAGTYLLSARGGFCTDPITLTVLETPPVVDTINGKDTVCLGRFYTYKAGAPLPGTVFEWQVVGGNITPASGPIVTVQWTGTSAKRLSVRRVSITPPYCESDTIERQIFEEIINPNITGDTAPCANTTKSYSSNYFRGEVYDWEIIPNTAGSVVSGNHSANINVLWNHATAVVNAKLVAIIRKCDSVKTDTLDVMIQAGLPFDLVSVSDDTVCPRDIISFTATVGGGVYRWNFGNGEIVAGSHAIDYSYWLNSTSVNQVYLVTVEGLPGTGGCPSIGIDSVYITVKPGPGGILSCTTPLPKCPADTAELFADISTNAGAITYTWHGGGWGTGSHHWLTSGGLYSVTATAANGCSFTTNAVKIETKSCSSGEGSCMIPATATVNCGAITLSAGFGLATGNWTADIMPIGGGLPSATNPVTATYNHSGVYRFRFVGTYDTCETFRLIDAYIYLMPKFYWEIKCGTSGFDTILLREASEKISGATITAISWNDLTTPVPGFSSTSSTNIVRASGSSNVIELNVTFTTPGGSSMTCSIQNTINIPAALSVNYTYTTSPTCERVPIFFTPVLSGDPVSHFWDFGDNSSLYLENAKREYTFEGPVGPDFREVKLVVQDSKGCLDSNSHLMSIYRNALAGDISGDTIACASSAPIPIGYISLGGTPSSLIWSPITTTVSPSTTFNVTESGSYWVTVFDAFGCQQTIPIEAKKIKILPSPNAEIRGQRHYCIGDPFNLNGYIGTDVLYDWFLDGVSLHGGFGYYPSLVGSAWDTGAFEIQLHVRVIDSATGYYCDDIAVDSVYIHALPEPPVITGPLALDCDLYHLQLTATEPVSGTYNWSNGAYGPINDIYNGGPYRVWFTNLWGCKRDATVYVPLSPRSFFPYFPSGCYQLCEKQLPLVLHGPPGEFFDSWSWLKDYSIVSSGIDTMSSYTINSGGSYQWILGNGLCIDTSGVMNLDTIACDKCQGIALTASIVCDTTNPASYQISVGFNVPVSGTSYVLGTDIGPITPFSGVVPGAGLYTTGTITFTTLITSPLPDSVTIQLALTQPYGSKCYEEVRVPLDTCHWIAERSQSNEDTVDQGISSINILENALSVFPNPTTGDVTLSYYYGVNKSLVRSISIFDVTGRKMAEEIPVNASGNWILNTSEWSSGIYVIRMLDDNKIVQTQRLVVSH